MKGWLLSMSFNVIFGLVVGGVMLYLAIQAGFRLYRGHIDRKYKHAVMHNSDRYRQLLILNNNYDFHQVDAQWIDF